MCWLLLCAVLKGTPLAKLPRRIVARAVSDYSCVDMQQFDLYDLQSGGCACGFFIADWAESIDIELEKARQRWQRKGFAAAKIERMLADKYKITRYKNEMSPHRQSVLALEDWLNGLCQRTHCYLLAYWQHRGQPELAGLPAQVQTAKSLHCLQDNQWYQWCGNAGGQGRN